MEPWDAQHVKREKVCLEFHLEHQERAMARKADKKGSEWSTAVGIIEMWAEIKAKVCAETGPVESWGPTWSLPGCPLCFCSIWTEHNGPLLRPPRWPVSLLPQGPCTWVSLFLEGSHPNFLFAYLLIISWSSDQWSAP